jgi:hypothetical protein
MVIICQLQFQNFFVAGIHMKAFYAILCVHLKGEDIMQSEDVISEVAAGF